MFLRNRSVLALLHQAAHKSVTYVRAQRAWRTQLDCWSAAPESSLGLRSISSMACKCMERLQGPGNDFAAHAPAAQAC